MRGPRTLFPHHFSSPEQLEKHLAEHLWSGMTERDGRFDEPYLLRAPDQTSADDTRYFQFDAGANFKGADVERRKIAGERTGTLIIRSSQSLVLFQTSNFAHRNETARIVEVVHNSTTPEIVSTADQDTIILRGVMDYLVNGAGGVLPDQSNSTDTSRVFGPAARG